MLLIVVGLGVVAGPGAVKGLGLVSAMNRGLGKGGQGSILVAAS